MPQRLHLEGSDPHELLVRAREQYGPHVTVVRAERVRTGGVMGFFAREKYELTLEVPDASLAVEGDGSRPAIGAGASSSSPSSSSPLPSSGAPAASSSPSAELAAEIADAQAMREEMFAGSAPVGEVAEALAAVSAGSPESGDSASEAPPTSAEEFRKALEEFTLPARADAPAAEGEPVAPGAATPGAEASETAVSHDASVHDASVHDAGSHDAGSHDAAANDNASANANASADADLAAPTPPEVSAAAVAGAIREFTPAAFPAADPDAVVLPTVRADERREESESDAIVIPQLAPEEDSRGGAGRAARSGDSESELGYEIPQLAPEEGTDGGAGTTGTSDRSAASKRPGSPGRPDAPAGPGTASGSRAAAGPSAGSGSQASGSRASGSPVRSGSSGRSTSAERPAAAAAVELESSVDVTPDGGASAVPPAARESGSVSAPARESEGVVLHRWGVQADLTEAVQTGSTVAELLALGVPPRLLGERLVLSDRVPLLDIVARLGVPTQRRLEPGELLVVVGAPERARAVAAQVVAWMGLPEQSLVLAGECEAIRGHGRRVRTEQAARAVRHRAAEAASEGVATVVALGVAPGRRGAVAAVPLLEAFDADASWAAVDASEAYGSAAALEPLAAGAHLEGIAAMGVGRSQAPAALLDASLPVAWMDGLPASPVVWAALLAERLSTAP